MFFRRFKRTYYDNCFLTILRVANSALQSIRIFFHRFIFSAHLPPFIILFDRYICVNTKSILFITFYKYTNITSFLYAFLFLVFPLCVPRKYFIMLAAHMQTHINIHDDNNFIIKSSPFHSINTSIERCSSQSLQFIIIILNALIISNINLQGSCLHRREILRNL